MSRPRPYLLLSIALPVLLLGALLMLLRPQPSAPIVAPSSPDVSEQMADMRGEVQRLQRQVQFLSQRQSPPASVAPSPTAEAPRPPPLTQEEVSAHDKRRFEGLAIKLAAEPVDRSWAPATERLIADTLARPAFKGSKLLAASCRSTLCRFEVSHDSETDRRTFSSTLPNRLPSLPSGSMRNAEGSERKTIVYVAREGHRIPRDEQQ